MPVVTGSRHAPRFDLAGYLGTRMLEQPDTNTILQRANEMLADWGSSRIRSFGPMLPFASSAPMLPGRPASSPDQGSPGLLE
jgi:hypothetical protein